MPPRSEHDDTTEDTTLLNKNTTNADAEQGEQRKSFQLQTQSSSFSSPDSPFNCLSNLSQKSLVLLFTAAFVVFGRFFFHHAKVTVGTSTGTLAPTGPYKLIEAQEGKAFFDSYDFYDGPDSLGSAGYNVYVARERAQELGIAKVLSEAGDDGETEEEFVYMSSSASGKVTEAVTDAGTQGGSKKYNDKNEEEGHEEEKGNDKSGMRESVRLEGKMRFNRGLFILDVRHMPDGCGVWPAFWLTDEANWPRNGEVDILEGVNGQTVSKTALHTSDQCDMYAHVPPYAKTGDWEWVTGIPETYTGEPDFNTAKAADNCWVMAQHQWQNEGCTAVHDRNNTLGKPVNDNGGGIYVLEWDPENRYIKSWVFSPREDIPSNLKEAMETASLEDVEQRIMPDPHSWGLPYAYFAIGKDTGCSADHFKNMRIVFNLAFCGNVSGNRFLGECPLQAEQFDVEGDPVQTCNAYIGSDPKELEEAYWKIKGVYVYEREMRKVEKESDESASSE